MSQDLFKEGKLLGSKHLSVIQEKGKKWKERNVPVYIRENLMVSFYITQVQGDEVLHVIQSPVAPGEKVHFIAFARRAITDEEGPT